MPRDSSFSAARSASSKVGGGASAAPMALSNTLSNRLSMVPEVGQRRHEIVAQGIGGAPARAPSARLQPPRLRQSIAQFDDDALGGFLADAGNAGQPATSPRWIAPTSSRGSMPDSTDNASFGPIPLTAISRSNIASSSARREAEERELILADVRVHAQRDLRAGLAGGVERRQRHRHVVADAATSTITRLGCFSSTRPRRNAIMQVCSGARIERTGGSRPTAVRSSAGLPLRARRSAGYIECRWQIATASASAASCGSGARSSPSSSLIICCTCAFSARP